MGLVKNIKMLKSNSKERIKLDKIIDKLPSNYEVVEDILKIIGNKTTKVVFDNDIKNNYYTYLNDTIYLTKSKKFNDKNRSGRICVVAHECRHSVQSKILQNINFILSNLELLSFIIMIILTFIKFVNITYLFIYFGIIIISIIPRLILEIDAVIKSVPIAKKYLETKLKKDDVEYVENYYSIHTKMLLPIFIFSLLFERINIGNNILV